ncbi:MAG TPA: 16S rRNA (cytosine(1402)-N(4))-methyltransferase RsmH [Bacteroidetes bacterium]|nr:16S rRNA (cytosine(1402)-N(4))-methyltransferase RsmH [Bacteroidota bacterium]
MKTEYHSPALFAESIEKLNLQKDGVYVDATFGGGGHSAGILKELGEKGHLIAFDKDADAQQNRIEDARLQLIKTDFKFIDKVLEEAGIDGVDGILADLGISSHQIDVAERGFSFRFDAVLDMRMDRENEMSAVEVLNEYSESELLRIFRDFGEIRQAARLAATIVKSRSVEAIATTARLRGVVAEMVKATNLNKILTLVYQALRIEVNQELEALEMLLEGGLKMLKPGGRMAIISYHSLEDRMVKHFFRFGNLQGEDRRDFYGRSLSPLKVITRKAVMPSTDEIDMNPRARSARLRVAERIEIEE